MSLYFSYPVAFTYRLKPQNENVMSKGLSRYVLQEMTDHNLTYFIRPPAPGSYLLTIFAREFLDGVSPKTMITFRSVAEYKVVCDSTSDEATLPFPYCSDSSWGLDMYASFTGSRLIPNHRTAVVFCPTGHGSVSLKLADPELRIYARLIRDGLAFDILKRAVTVLKEDSQVVIDVELPEPGEYGLEVFVNDPYKDGKLFAHFCQYLFTTDTQGSFASVYKLSHEMEAESVDAEEITAAGNNSDIVEDEPEVAICAQLSEKSVVIAKLTHEQVSEEQAATESDQQALEEVQEEAKEVDQQTVEEPEKDEECLEKVEDDEQEEEPAAAVAEEVIVSTEQTEAETIPASERTDDVVAEERVRDEAGLAEVRDEAGVAEVRDEAGVAEVKHDQEETSQESAEAVTETNVESQEAEVETAAAMESEVFEVAEKPETDAAVMGEVKNDQEDRILPSEVAAEVSDDIGQDVESSTPDSQQATEHQESIQPSENEEQAAAEETPEEVTEVMAETEPEETLETNVPVEEPTDDQKSLDKTESSQQEAYEELRELSVETLKTETTESSVTADEEASVGTETEQVAVEEVTDNQQPASEESTELEVTTEVEQAEAAEVGVTEGDQPEELKEDDGRADEQTVEEPKESQPCIDEMNSDQEIPSETLPEMETEKPAAVDQQTDNLKTDEECLDEFDEAQQQDSSEVPVQTQKADAVERSAPEDQYAAEEPKKGQEELEDQGRAGALTDEQLKQLEVEDIESGDKSATEDLTAGASEETADAEVADVEPVESTVASLEEAEKDETLLEQVEESQQAAEHEKILDQTENEEQLASEETLEEATEVMLETESEETVESSLTADEEAPEDTETEQVAVEEVMDDQKQPVLEESTELEVTTEVEQVEAAEVCVAEGDDAAEELTEDHGRVDEQAEELTEDHGRVDEQTVEELMESQPCVEQMKSDHEIPSEKLPEIVPEVLMEPEKPDDVETGEPVDQQADESKTDEELEEVETTVQQEVTAEDEQADAKDVESTDLPVEEVSDYDTTVEHVESDQQAASEELPPLSAEVSVQNQEPDAEETADVEDKKTASDVSTQDQDMAGQQTKLEDSDNVIIVASEDALKEPVPEEQEQGTHEVARMEEFKDQKMDRAQPGDSGTEEQISSSVAVIEHSKAPDDTAVCPEEASEQQQKVSETETSDAAPTEDTDDMHVSALHFFSYLLSAWPSICGKKTFSAALKLYVKIDLVIKILV